jgi:hypothetical protein
VDGVVEVLDCDPDRPRHSRAHIRVIGVSDELDETADDIAAQGITGILAVCTLCVLERAGSGHLEISLSLSRSAPTKSIISVSLLCLAIK